MFLDAIRKLAVIPGVQKFELLRQTGKKNNYDYGVSMEFRSPKAYEDYNQYPDHIAFVQNYRPLQIRVSLSLMALILI